MVVLGIRTYDSVVDNHLALDELLELCSFLRAHRKLLPRCLSKDALRSLCIYVHYHETAFPS